MGSVLACPPADFEEHAAIILSMTEMLACSAPTAYQMFKPLVERMALIAIVNGEEQRRQAIAMLTDWGVPVEGIYFAYMPIGTWTRDFGPFFVRGQDRSVWVLDAEYRYEGRSNEDVVPRAIASLLRLPCRQVPLVLEGGNLLSNGWGLSLSTTALVDVNRMNGRNYDASQIRSIFNEYYGFTQTVLVEPLLSHRTLHVDMFTTFTAPDVVVVGACDPAEDKDSAKALDHNARLLSQSQTRGRRLRVERIPMPPYNGKCCRSYTNVIFANGALLVPSYPDVDQEIEELVLATYARLLPDWDLIRIDCGPMMFGGGALRCASAHVPAWLGQQFSDYRPPRRISAREPIGQWYLSNVR